jgi:spore coat assembly protein SafA
MDMNQFYFPDDPPVNAQNPTALQISCPPGFSFSYSVKPGDTMFLIARRFGITLQQLIAANSSLSNPNLIYPGEVLCVPTPLRFPCCVVLGRQLVPPALPADAQGVALVQALTTGEYAVSVLAVQMPPPSNFGNFDIYEGFINVPIAGGFGFQMYLTENVLPVWAASITLPPVLTPDSAIIVRPVNLQGTSGQTVLISNLSGCVARTV